MHHYLRYSYVSLEYSGYLTYLFNKLHTSKLSFKIKKHSTMVVADQELVDVRGEREGVINSKVMLGFLRTRKDKVLKQCWGVRKTQKQKGLELEEGWGLG